MTNQEAFLRGCLIADRMRDIYADEKEHREQLAIWNRELSKYEGSVPTPMPSPTQQQ